MSTQEVQDFFRMESYHNNSLGIMSSLTSLSIAMIGFSRNFSSRNTLILISFCMIILAITIGMIYTWNFGAYIMHTPNDHLPRHISKTSTIIYFISIFIFQLLLLLIGIILARSEII